MVHSSNMVLLRCKVNPNEVAPVFMGRVQTGALRIPNPRCIPCTPKSKVSEAAAQKLHSNAPPVHGPRPIPLDLKLSATYESGQDHPISCMMQDTTTRTLPAELTPHPLANYSLTKTRLGVHATGQGVVSSPPVLKSLEAPYEAGKHLCLPLSSSSFTVRVYGSFLDRPYCRNPREGSSPPCKARLNTTIPYTYHFQVIRSCAPLYSSRWCGTSW